MKKVLVAVDFSAATVRVCNAAARLARSLGARLLLLHVIPPAPLVMADYMVIDPAAVDAATREARKRAAKRMDSLGRWFRKRIPNTRVLMHAGPVVRTIRATVNAVRPDYLVIGSHGHTAAYDLLVGSVAHGLLRKATCPVVLVPIARRLGSEMD